MILDRLGFEEPVVIAGLLHDVVEDTAATLEDVRDRFGDEVAATVAHCSEVKLDADGRKRPWLDRKRDHLAALAEASVAARAVVLADKLHNLLSIRVDLEEGRDVWSTFNAPRDRVLWYYRATLDALADDDPKLRFLGDECRAALDEVAAIGGPCAEFSPEAASGLIGGTDGI